MIRYLDKGLIESVAGGCQCISFGERKIVLANSARECGHICCKENIAEYYVFGGLGGFNLCRDYKDKIIMMSLRALGAESEDLTLTGLRQILNSASRL